MHRLDNHFGVFVPNGRSVNPKSSSNWEGAGVQPDLGGPSTDDSLRGRLGPLCRGRGCPS